MSTMDAGFVATALVRLISLHGVLFFFNNGHYSYALCRLTGCPLGKLSKGKHAALRAAGIMVSLASALGGLPGQKVLQTIMYALMCVYTCYCKCL